MNPVPNASKMPCSELGIATRCLWDFTGTIKPSQSVLLSISGYSLASDAKSKDFQIKDGGNRKDDFRENSVKFLKTISFTEIRRRNAKFLLKPTVKAGWMMITNAAGNLLNRELGLP